MSEVTHNPMWMFASATIENLDTMAPQAYEDNEEAMNLGIQEANIYQAFYKPSDWTPTSGQAPDPDASGGLLTYDDNLLQWLEQVLAKDSVPGSGGEKNVPQDEAALSKAQSQFQADNTSAQNTENQVDSALKQAESTIKIDDANTTQMAGQTKVFMGFEDFAAGILSRGPLGRG